MPSGSGRAASTSTRSSGSTATGSSWATDVGFNVGCFVNGYSGLIVGDGTNFGPYSMIHTANHNMEDPERPVTEQGWRDEPPVRDRAQLLDRHGSAYPARRADRRRVRDRSGQRRHARRRERIPWPSATPPRASAAGADRGPMRVLFLQQQPCMRALKYAAGLAQRAPEIELGFAYRGLTLSELYGAGDELFAGWWPLGDDPAPRCRRSSRSSRRT